MAVVPGMNGDTMANSIASSYNELLGKNGSKQKLYVTSSDHQTHPDSELGENILRHVGGKDVFIVQQTWDPNSKLSAQDAIIDLLQVIRAAKESRAHHVTAVIPYLPYARQDKSSAYSREAVTARLMGDLYHVSGADMVIAWHMHAAQIKGMFYPTIAVDLDPVTWWKDIFKEYKGMKDTLVLAPDMGAGQKCKYLAKALDLGMAVGSKFRLSDTDVEYSQVAGDFRGIKRLLITDDIIASAGTMYGLINLVCDEHKEIEEVYISASHLIGNGKAKERLIKLHEQGRLTQLHVTDSIPLDDRFAGLDFIVQTELAPVFAQVLNSVHYDESISNRFWKPKKQREKEKMKYA